MASAVTASCPCCARGECLVREGFLQATRSEPMRSLGFQGYCPSCDLCFKVAVSLPEVAV